MKQMKQIITGILMATCMFSCAIGKLEEAADALEEVKVKIGELAVGECMSKCSTSSRTCFYRANHTCIDACEKEHNTCTTNEESCLNNATYQCSMYTGAQFHTCKNPLKKKCDVRCDKKFSDCGQICGDQIQDCLFEGSQSMVSTTNVSFSNCMTSCVQDIEDTLQEFD